MIVPGSNDHLQSRELLNAHIDGSTPSSEAVGEETMTLLFAMTEAEKSIRQCFARQLVKDIFVLSPGYASLSKPLQFVCVMVVLLAEGRLDVVISAPNRQMDPNLYYPLRSELSAQTGNSSDDGSEQRVQRRHLFDKR